MKRRNVLASIAVGPCLFALLMLAGSAWFGSYEAFTSYLAGDAVCFAPRTVDLGQRQAGARVNVFVSCRNLTSKDVAIVGHKSTCRCIVSEEMPIALGPGTTVRVGVRVHLPKDEPCYDQLITFMIAEANQLAMHPIRVRATILNPNASSRNETREERRRQTR